MRRLMVLVALAAVAAAVGVWLMLRGGGAADANSRATTLLPRETLAFLHVPDFNRAREQWRQTDIYKLWREPAVQEFMRKPLSQVPESGSAEQRMQQLERLGMKDAFVAVTSWDGQRQATVVGGFRFKASKADVEQVIGEWRARMQGEDRDAKLETVQHQRHRIEVVRRPALTIATVYDRDWFFAANDVAALTAMLDRANSRTTDAATTLAGDAAFNLAAKQMPAASAAFVYAKPEAFSARAAARETTDGDQAVRLALIRQIRSVSAATTFENGKIRDVLFVVMPKAADLGELKRASLALATSDTFLYLATLLSLPADGAVLNGASPVPGAGLATALQPLAARLGDAGVSMEQWNSAFGAELGVIGEWPTNARVPALLATLPVKDGAIASDIAAAITASAGEARRWTLTERDRVRYYSQPPANPLLPLSPTIGIRADRAIFGFDVGSVESAMNRALGTATGAELAASERFQAAQGAVRAAEQASAYIDTALLYAKVDAALRPMLIMGTAFVPAIAQAVDFNKVPPVEVVTRHLSPIVMSQSYIEGGYLTESVGPISIHQAALGIAVATGAGANWYRANVPAGGPAGGAPVLSVPAPPASPAATP